MAFIALVAFAAWFIPFAYQHSVSAPAIVIVLLALTLLLAIGRTLGRIVRIAIVLAGLVVALRFFGVQYGSEALTSFAVIGVMILGFYIIFGGVFGRR